MTILIQFRPFENLASHDDLDSLDKFSSDDRNAAPVLDEGVRDINAPRFIASLGLLLTCGFINLIANGHTVGRILLLPLCFFVFEWYRIHGSLTLTRKLRAVLNVASVLATYQEFDPLYQKLYSADLFCGQLPQLNTELPRTADERSDQDKSPPASKNKDISENLCSK